MMTEYTMLLSQLGIVCESGGFRCVFVHGALDALEAHDIRAAVYAAASASVMPAAFAAVGLARNPGVAYWHNAHDVRIREGNGMSEMVLAGLAKYAPLVEPNLFAGDAPQFIVAASEVIEATAAEETQGPLASRLGREQLLKMAGSDDSWPAAVLRAATFNSRSSVAVHASEVVADIITRDNFREVAYASTRMLHAWRVPAIVEGRPFVDASYTDAFPVRALASTGVRTLLAIATGVGEAYTNLYRRERIADSITGATIEHIAPLVDLKEFGVDFTTATREGLDQAYQHGRDVANGWIASHAGAF